jgi:hypothetical protein
MWKEFYASASLLDLPLIAMWLFMGTFVVVVIRALTAKKSDDDTLRMLPLENDVMSEKGAHHVA